MTATQTDFSLTAPGPVSRAGRDTNVLPANRGTDYSQVALTAWLSAQLSAYDAVDVTTELDAVNERLRNGDLWIKEHGPTNPRYREAERLRYRLYDQQKALLIQFRVAAYACWVHCCETYAAASHINHQTWLDEHEPGRLLSLEHPAFVWRSLCGTVPPPGAWPPQQEEGWIEKRLSWLPIWEVGELKACLERAMAARS